MITLSNLLI